MLYDSDFLLGEMVNRKCNLVTVLLDPESGPWSMKIAFGEVTVFGDFFQKKIDFSGRVKS